MDKRRSTSFAIMIVSLGPVLLAWQQQVALRFSKPRITHLALMPSVSAFWGVSGESAWIMYWSSMKNSCIGSYVPMSSISTGRDHIKASVSRFPKEKLPAFHQHSLMNESSQFRSQVGYTMSTEEWLERFNSEAEVPEKIA